MKVLVYQVRIGIKNIHGDRYNVDTGDFYTFEQNNCIPSVKKWAEKCGYDYKLYTESTLLDNGFFKKSSDLYSAEKMMHLFQQDYEHVIYVDSDIFVSSRAGEFPIKEGLSVVFESIPLDDYLKSFPFSETKNPSYFNAGVLSVDRGTGKKMYEYFMQVVESGDNSLIYQAEQDIINSWIMKNKCNELDENWNYLLHTYNRTTDDVLYGTNNFDLDKRFFYHFISESKLEYKSLFRKIKHFV